jgi:hypothetical protein
VEDVADRAAAEAALKIWPDIAISHGGSDRVDREAQQDIGDSWSGRVQQQFTLRSRGQVARFFAGTDLVEPGVVPAEEWRPEPGAGGEGKSTVWCAVGRKRPRGRGVLFDGQ